MANIISVDLMRNIAAPYELTHHSPPTPPLSPPSQLPLSAFDPVGNSPNIISVELMRKIAPSWADMAVRMMADEGAEGARTKCVFFRGGWGGGVWRLGYKARPI